MNKFANSVKQVFVDVLLLLIFLIAIQAEIKMHTHIPLHTNVSVYLYKSTYKIVNMYCMCVRKCVAKGILKNKKTKRIRRKKRNVIDKNLVIEDYRQQSTTQ